MGYYRNQLPNIRTAIEELVSTGQSTSYGGRSLTMANLTELRNLLADYEARAALEPPDANPTLKQGRNRISYIVPKG